MRFVTGASALAAAVYWTPVALDRGSAARADDTNVRPIEIINSPAMQQQQSDSAETPDGVAPR
jgi:hypothetical protein